MTYRENKIADLIADLKSRNDCKTGENLVTRKKEILWKITYKEFEVIKMVTQIILSQFGDKEKVKELNC